MVTVMKMIPLLLPSPLCCRGEGNRSVQMLLAKVKV